MVRELFSSSALSAVWARIGGRVLANQRLMRAPIWLYRARLGFLFGSRLLMLEHVGRRSGARRYVVLEVIGRPAPDIYLVASGFGEKAQWFRNVQAHPRVRVSVAGRPPRGATARDLAPAEAETVLGAYARRNPRAWNLFRPILDVTLGGAEGNSSTSPPIVELRLDTPRAT